MLIEGTFINADCYTILTELQTELRLNGSNLLTKINPPTRNSIQICCPYHKSGMERKPSAGVRVSDGMFHCFACNEVHNLPEVISHCFGHEDLGVFGLQWIVKHFGTVQKEDRKDIELDLQRTDSGKSSQNYVSEEELKRYRWIHKYMYARGLTDDIIELFDVGFDPKTKCITFPVRDISGGCLFVARRSVKTKFFNYPEGVEKPLYGLYELHQLEEFPKELIICESMLDALTCWVYGKYAVALNGLGNDLQFKQLKELPCRELILATDNDERGIAARKRIRMNIGSSKLISEYIIPHIHRDDGKITKDINDLKKEEFLNLVKIY